MEKHLKNVGIIILRFASLTKPLTIGLIQFLHPEFVKNKDTIYFLIIDLVSNLGLLSKHNWRDQISSYQVKESEVAVL